MSVVEIEHRFRFHPALTAEKQGEHESVRHIMMTTALSMELRLPEGREKSIVITKLEEAMFWANAAIARVGSD